MCLFSHPGFLQPPSDFIYLFILNTWARPGFSDPDGLDDPSAEAEEAEKVEEEVSLEAMLPGAILQAERYGWPPRLASPSDFRISEVNEQGFIALTRGPT